MNINHTTYTIDVTVATFWATGRMRGTRVHRVEVTEDATILGGCRAIDAAVESTAHVVDTIPPSITPNPAEQGWPVGV